jgi:NADH dehydrogenase
MTVRAPRPHVPQVVIIGGGFAGLSAARTLARARVDVTVVDRTNHHLFQPLLYQVATAVLPPSDIAVPIRLALRTQRNARVVLADVTGVDTGRRRVRLDDGGELAYDYLIVAAGARHAYFGHDDWEARAPGLKSLDDALEIRRRFLLAFERAERTDDPERQAAEQTFVVVGGGPTGVELAGTIPEVARHTLAGDFRRVDTRRTRVILLEGGPRILPSFDPELSERARRDLEALGVEVRTGAAVTRIDDDAVWVGAERIPTRTVLWGAGNTASPLGRQLGAPVDRAGRVLVARDLSLPDREEVFVVGDLAAIQSDGAPVPAVATAANQMGVHAARNVIAALAGRPRAPFVYLDKGSMATLGRHKAVAQIGRLRIGGYVAWMLWAFVHLLHLVGFRNRASVLMEWAYSYFTYERGVRLITGATPAEPAPMASGTTEEAARRRRAA